jgi:outer membrane protein TolC
MVRSSGIRRATATGLVALSVLGSISASASAEEAASLPPLTAHVVGLRAAATSFDAKASIEEVRAAAARVDQSWSAFLPRLSGAARYTRDSNFTPPTLPGQLVATTAPAGTVNPKDTVSVAISFPTVLDNYSLQATIAVPLSDYFVRIAPAYAAAKHARAAAEHDERAARARALSDGEVAFYTWLRARAAVGVARQALRDQEAHHADAKKQLDAGNASVADVLRADTNVASAEYTLEQARSLANVTETQLRTALHVAEGVPLAVVEALDGPLPEVGGTLDDRTLEGTSSREEVKSLQASEAAARNQVTVARGGSLPVVSAFADAIDANPNPRVIPETPRWYATWDAGVQVVWSPNDVLLANGRSHEAVANVDRLTADRERVQDAIRIEVRQAWEAVRQADVDILSATRELTSATEAYGVASSLFNNGRGTSTTLTDAETELTRARLDLLNARADARIARVRLDHASGRDVGRE